MWNKMESMESTWNVMESTWNVMESTWNVMESMWNKMESTWNVMESMWNKMESMEGIVMDSTWIPEQYSIEFVTFGVAIFGLRHIPSNICRTTGTKLGSGNCHSRCRKL